MRKKIYIGVAVYNEGKNIEKTLEYLEKSLNEIKSEIDPKIFVCLNGCTDSSEFLLNKIKSNYKFPLEILECEKGKLKAHKKILEDITDDNPIMFMDADVLVPSKTIIDLVENMEKNKNIKIISAYPYASKPRNLNLYQRIMFPILNIKRIYPKVEIAKNDVSEFHQNTQNDFVRKSRIYFHGRCFIIRDKKVYEFPKNGSKIIGDDTFLSFVTIKKQPKDSIMVLFNSQVYSQPIFSLKHYLKTWYRIRKDMDYIYQEYPEFKEQRDKREMTLNWKYVIRELPLSYKIYASIFNLIRKYEAISYKIIKNKIDLEKIWSYKEK